MRGKLFALPACLGLALLATPAHAVEPITLAADSCAGCHGTDGQSRGAMPAFNTKTGAELKTLLREYKTGKREATVMDRIVKGYSDEQLDAMVDYFAKKK